MNQMTEMLAKLNARLDLVVDQAPNEAAEHSSAPTRTQGGRTGGSTSLQHNSSIHSYVPKTIKLDFPRFNSGGDPTSWICRAKQFFQIHETPTVDQVTLASFHLEGDAQLWYQLLKQERITITWEEFKQGLHTRFGPNQFFNFFGELTKLQQTGTVEEYQGKFEKLLARAGHLPQAQQVSCFISGLRDTIRTDIQANRPTDLTSAIGLARLYEARDLAHKPSKVLSTHSEAQNDPATMPIKKLTTEEIDESRRKGLCFKCNEKFGPGHRCKKLFMIQACFNESDADEEMEIMGESPENQWPQ
ncbi:hypothetical protein LWI29_023257 [Acer saccharum]|uniref:Retrotransposon gag domain-containing protein n=1 Tax=Acer saccharum TaxID=4024 RepID=A0AA39REY0_ACESA|nr:hypothetical protein LWI29_023257 [Acer saccharum]